MGFFYTEIVFSSLLSRLLLFRSGPDWPYGHFGNARGGILAMPEVAFWQCPRGRSVGVIISRPPSAKNDGIVF